MAKTPFVKVDARATEAAGTVAGIIGTTGAAGGRGGGIRL